MRRVFILGVKTRLSLSQAQALFPNRDITSLEATKRGVIDTTYRVYTNSQNYILKKYERASSLQIEEEQDLLNKLSQSSLNVPKPIESVNEWHLFSLLAGEIPHKISLQQLRSIGNFLGRFHWKLRHHPSSFRPFTQQEYRTTLAQLRKKKLLYSKRLSALNDFPQEIDGIIHGDLFCDNSKFDGAILAVFDFIEAGSGSFTFDLGVVAMSWVAKKRLSTLQLQILLQAYNQQVKKKIVLDDLYTMIHYAALVYSLKRFMNPDSTLDYKEMLAVDKKIEHFKKNSSFKR